LLIILSLCYIFVYVISSEFRNAFSKLEVLEIAMEIVLNIVIEAFAYKAEPEVREFRKSFLL